VVPLILLIAFILLVLAGAVGVKSCRESVDRTDIATSAPSNDIVALRDGATMVAKPGTVGRELVDWLASDEQSRAFELGGEEFLNRSAEPTLESKVRMPRLIAMLKANPDVQVHVIGHSDRSSDPVADQTLSEARARIAVLTLKEGGVSASRVSFEGRGGEQPIADNRSAEGRVRNQRVSIVLTRKQ
jgi:outer membrane protein OmpA-like peptidoglycan-associated protein